MDNKEIFKINDTLANGLANLRAGQTMSLTDSGGHRLWRTGSDYFLGATQKQLTADGVVTQWLSNEFYNLTLSYKGSQFTVNQISAFGLSTGYEHALLKRGITGQNPTYKGLELATYSTHYTSFRQNLFSVLEGVKPASIWNYQMSDGADGTQALSDTSVLREIWNHFAPIYSHYADGSVDFRNPSVAHGLTDLAPTNTWGQLRWWGTGTTKSGVGIRGFGENASGSALTFAGVNYSAPTAGTAAIRLIASKGNTTSDQALAAGDTALALYNYTTPLLRVLGNGNLELISQGDIYTTVRTDYLSISTKIGWTGSVVGHLYYKKVGALIYIWIDMSGTSNNTVTSFTIPYTASHGQQFACRIADNGIYAVGFGLIANGSSTVTVYPGPDGTVAWTASGSKQIEGEFFVEGY